MSPLSAANSEGETKPSGLPGSSVSPSSDDQAASQRSAPAYARDERYYCEEMVILVEGVFFKIPRFVLQDSELFQNMFAVPPPPDAIVDGSDDEHPLRLDGYLADDFRQLLRVVLPLSTIAQESMTWQQWASVLKLSTMWGFHAVRQKAITNIASSAIDPVDKIILSKKHDVSAWLVPTLNQLAQREQPLIIEDAQRLSQVAGWEFSLQLGHVRETYLPVSPLQFGDLNWTRTCACTTFRCNSHNSQFTASSPTSHVIWPCPSCTQYQCIQGHRSFNKPSQAAPTPRSEYDFTPTICRIYQIPS